MEQKVSSDFKLGIIAGGQLAKMLILSSSNWDVQTYVMDKEVTCPAGSICNAFVSGSPQSYEDVLNFGRKVDMLTFELENVNIEALKQLKSEGLRICPDPDIIETIQDKGLQKQFYDESNIPTAPFELYDGIAAIREAVAGGKHPFPFVQKLRTGGYDGQGVKVIRSESDLDKLLDGPSVIEEMVPIQKEVSVIVARNANGDTQCFPLVEMEFSEEANLVECLFCPADVDPKAEVEAFKIASDLASAFKLRGILAVEFFIDKEGRVIVNEAAPRPHNSGHHTIESVVTSQYEQMLRAIFNFPMGSTQLKIPAVMVNLLGEAGYEGAVQYEGFEDVMSIEGVKVHLYGKKETRPFRKMGHVTIIDSDLDTAKRKADSVKQKLKVKA